MTKPETKKIRWKLSKLAAELEKTEAEADYEENKRELTELTEELDKKRAESGFVNTGFGRVHIEQALFRIVLLSGALGSLIFAARSFAVHKGNKSFKSSWLWWYLLRIPVGMGIAVMLYLVLRGGLFAGSFEDRAAATSRVNPFGFAALGALAGMFSRQATAKLEEIFENIFRTEAEANKGAKPEKPEIKDISPKEIAAAAQTEAERTITISGEGFLRESVVLIGNKTVKHQFKDNKNLTVVLAKNLIKAGTKFDIIVENPAEKGGKSRATTLKIGS